MLHPLCWKSVSAPIQDARGREADERGGGGRRVRGQARRSQVRRRSRGCKGTVLLQYKRHQTSLNWFKAQFII